jgi:hypothetical protein
LGVVLVSQRISHYSEEMLSNISTRVLLRINENDIRFAKNKLGIKDDRVFSQLDSAMGVIAVNAGNSVEVAAAPWYEE